LPRVQAKPASSNVGDFAPLSFKELAAKKALTGGALTAAAAGGMAPGFSTQFCDVEVDPETGKVTILRFVAAQDVGKAIHASYVEGQIQGGVAQAIGWALTRSTSTIGTVGSTTPGSSTSACRSPPTFR
jgi:CO/xanthine dehydrogenase Mo-binding subunit